jgi:hypothetical protein
MTNFNGGSVKSICRGITALRSSFRPKTVHRMNQLNCFPGYVLVGRIRRKDHDYRRWIAAQVMDTRWNLEEPMTVEEITDLLRLASIDFHPDGGAGIYWDDQDRLYGGHNLITELDNDGKCIEVRREG